MIQNGPKNIFLFGSIVGHLGLKQMPKYKKLQIYLHIQKKMLNFAAELEK